MVFLSNEGATAGAVVREGKDGTRSLLSLSFDVPVSLAPDKEPIQEEIFGKEADDPFCKLPGFFLLMRSWGAEDL